MMANRLPLVAALLILLSAALPTRAADQPTIYLIGDSTVRNGTAGNGAGGLWGWGNFLTDHLDQSKIAVKNRALGGRSSRTFLTEGLWAKVAADLKPGDFVLMQFGHNDGGTFTGPRARASIKGTGDETKDVTHDNGKPETVHSYGWYLKQYITDAKAKGATPIVVSPIPRNMWKDGKVVRANNDYGKWAAEIAKAENVPFLDLNELIATRYETLGPEKVKTYFPGDHTHTNKEGAQLNAAIAAEGLKAMKDSPLAQYVTEEKK